MTVQEVCGSVKVRGKYPKNIRGNNVIKAAVERKESAWREVLGARLQCAAEKLG